MYRHQQAACWLSSAVDGRFLHHGSSPFKWGSLLRERSMIPCGVRKIQEWKRGIKTRSIRINNHSKMLLRHLYLKFVFMYENGIQKWGKRCADGAVLLATFFIFWLAFIAHHGWNCDANKGHKTTTAPVIYHQNNAEVLSLKSLCSSRRMIIIHWRLINACRSVSISMTIFKAPYALRQLYWDPHLQNMQRLHIE